MIILATGHNSADRRNRLHLRGIYERRLELLGFVVGDSSCQKAELGVL